MAGAIPPRTERYGVSRAKSMNIPYNQLSTNEQGMFIEFCHHYFNARYSGEEWKFLLPYVRLIEQLDIESSAKSFVFMIIRCKDEKNYHKDLSSFKESISEIGFRESIAIDYQTMTIEQKRSMIEYVSSITEYIFPLEQINKLFSTAPSDRAFVEFTKDRPDTYHRVFFDDFIWFRLIGEPAPDWNKFNAAHKKLAVRVKGEGPEMFDRLYDYDTYLNETRCANA